MYVCKPTEQMLDLTGLYKINVQACSLGTQFLTNARTYVPNEVFNELFCHFVGGVRRLKNPVCVHTCLFFSVKVLRILINFISNGELMDKNQ